MYANLLHNFCHFHFQPSSSIELRSLVRLSEHKSVAAMVRAFRQEHDDWKDLAAYLHSKQTGRHFKTKQQKLRAAKKGSKFLPDASTGASQKNSGVKRPVGSDQDGEAPKTEKRKQPEQPDSEDDEGEDGDEETADVCDASDKDSDGNESEEERSSDDNGSEDEDAGSDDGASASSKNENTCEDSNSASEEDEDESSVVSDDNWNGLSAIPPTKLTGKGEIRGGNSSKQSKDSDSSDKENSDNSESAEEECDDSEYEVNSVDSDNEGEETNRDGEESVEEDRSDQSKGSEEDNDDDNDCVKDEASESEEDDKSNRTSFSKIPSKKSAGRNENKGKKRSADSDATAVLTKLPSESNIIKDPFFLCGEEAEDNSGISSEEKSSHWIDKDSVAVPDVRRGWRIRGGNPWPQQRAGGRGGNPWPQQRDDRWLRGDQSESWQRADSHRGFRERGRGR